VKYRVKVDLSFASEADARAVMGYAATASAGAVSINEGEDNEQISFYELEYCGHDEGLPCSILDRVEIREQGV